MNGAPEYWRVCMYGPPATRGMGVFHVWATRLDLVSGLPTRYSSPMKVFLTWSGDRSHAVAKILGRYLPALINSVKPFLSSNGIATGARWTTEIATNLETANIGIICLTPDNQTAPWLLFEAGAVSKLSSVSRAMILRIGIEASDVKEPLSQFQSVSIDENGIWKMLKDILAANEGSIGEDVLQVSFKALWPIINSELQKAVSQTSEVEPPRRSSDELLREVLDLVRTQTMDSSEALIHLRALTRQKETEGYNLLNLINPPGGYLRDAGNLYGGLYGLKDAGNVNEVNPIYLQPPIVKKEE
jgi:hypothetical protein